MRYVLLCALLAACGGRKVPEAAPPDAAPVARPRPDAAPSPPAPALVVTLDGQPVEIKSILANRGNGGDVEVTFTNYEYPCAQLIDGFRPTSSETDVTFSVRLVRRLLVDGTFVWAHKGSYFDGTSSETMNGPGPALPGTPVVDGTAGATTRFELDLALEDQGLHARGPVEAIGCGWPTWYGEPEAEPTPLSDAVLDIAGEHVPIGGAGYLSGPKGTQVLLSSHPVACIADISTEVSSDHGLSSRGTVELYLTSLTKDAPRATIEGEWIDWATGEAGGLFATAGKLPAKKKGKGSTEARMVKVTLGGSATVNGYAIALSGSVDAVVCP